MDFAMSPHRYNPAKVFTIDEANAMLPLVRMIVADLADLSRDVIERQQRVEHLKAGRDMSAGNPYDDELAHTESELEKDRMRIRGFVKELRDLGVEAKSGPDGLVDFPAIVDGRLAYLCWKLGEPEILFWHDLDAGFVGRQPVTAEVTSGDLPDSR
jgi:hypothetical protein